MSQASRYQVLLAGVCSQIICIGIARFSYTPLLPVMQTQTWIGDLEGGWLAAANYAGYMLGALIAASVTDLGFKDKLYRWGLLMAVATTLAMPLSDNLWVWSGLRFLSGISSAASMLIASALILNWLIRHGHRSELGIHFAGVGIGIMVAALSVELLSYWALSWDQQWWAFGALAACLTWPAWHWLPRPHTNQPQGHAHLMQDQAPTREFMWLMLAAYFCAGYGYVISATFIVTIVERIPDLQGMGALTFAVVGLAAAPAVMNWDLIARRLGYLNALILAYSLQIIGIMLPIWVHTLEAALFSALLFGGTFIGCVSLVLTMAGRLYPSKPAKLMGKMTLAYGAAQMFAPALTGMLAEQSGNYDLGLALAGGFVAVGTVLIIWLKFSDPTAHQLDGQVQAKAVTR